MFSNFDVQAMVPVNDIDVAKKFYGETLELPVVSENMGGVLYKSGSGKLFVYTTPKAGTNQATTANWDVDDVKSVVEKLKAKGVGSWEQYEFPGAEHDGEVHIMGPIKAAWFRDPAGNILGLTEMGTSNG